MKEAMVLVASGSVRISKVLFALGLNLAVKQIAREDDAPKSDLKPQIDR